MTSVVILSPNRFSAYSVCVTAHLIESGVDVRGIVVRRLFSFARIKQEIRSDGLTNLLRKVCNKVIKPLLGRGSNNSTDTATTHSGTRSLDTLATEHSTPLLFTRDLNDDEVLNQVRAMEPDIVMFTGGGILREPLLDIPKIGIINVHMGILPRYRGMDPVDWALLERNPNQVGLTAHLMDKKIDVGPVILREYLPPSNGESIAQLRTRVENSMCNVALKACSELINHRISPEAQDVSGGRQYFRMHDRLKAIVTRSAGSG